MNKTSKVRRRKPRVYSITPIYNKKGMDIDDVLKKAFIAYFERELKRI